MENKKKFKPNQSRQLKDQICETLRDDHYAYRTAQTYVQWIKRVLAFYRMIRHSNTMGAPEIERYLSHLAETEAVAASTQRQALNAIVFSYRDVLDIDLGDIAPVRSKRHRKPPPVLTQSEVAQVLNGLEGTHRLMAQLT